MQACQILPSLDKCCFIQHSKHAWVAHAALATCLRLKGHLGMRVSATCLHYTAPDLFALHCTRLVCITLQQTEHVAQARVQQPLFIAFSDTQLTECCKMQPQHCSRNAITYVTSHRSAVRLAPVPVQHIANKYFHQT